MVLWDEVLAKSIHNITVVYMMYRHNCVNENNSSGNFKGLICENFSQLRVGMPKNTPLEKKVEKSIQTVVIPIIYMM